MSNRRHDLNNLEASGVRGVGGCLLWMGGRDGHDYGVVRMGRKKKSVARLTLAKTLGRELKKGECALHKCDNPPCFEESHLFLGTQKDNARDAMRKGRKAILRGEQSPPAKLTNKDVRCIRRLIIKGQLLQREIGELFGVSQVAISKIVLRKSWRHLT